MERFIFRIPSICVLAILSNRFEKRAKSVVVETFNASILDALAGIDLEEGQELKDLLGTEDYQKLEKITQYKGNYPSSLKSMLNTTKPIVVATNISRHYFQRNTNKPLDFVFIDDAKQNNQTLIALETAREQLDALRSIDMNEQIGILQDLLADKDINDFYTISDAYLEENIYAVDSFYMNYKESYPNFVDNMITIRNKIMSHRIDSLVKIESNRFIAIGVGHLAGNEGVLNILKAKKYIIEPVVPSYVESLEWVKVSDKDFICSFPNEKPYYSGEMVIKEKGFVASSYSSLQRIIGGEKTYFSVLKYIYEDKRKYSSIEDLKRSIENQKDGEAKTDNRVMKIIYLNNLPVLEIYLTNEDNKVISRTRYFLIELGKVVSISIFGKKRLFNPHFQMNLLILSNSNKS